MSDFSIKCDPLADTPLPAVQKTKQPEPTFAMPPDVPTQEAAEGIRFDFNNGLRVRFPEKGEFRCVFRDLDTDCLCIPWMSNRAAWWNRSRSFSSGSALKSTGMTI